MQTQQHQLKINEQYSTTPLRNSQTAPMSGGLPTPIAGGENTNDPNIMSNPYRSFNNMDSQMPFTMKKGKHSSEIVIDEYQSEKHFG